MENCARLFSPGRKPLPQLFLVCCLLSLLFGGISSLYFYYPESVSSAQYPYNQLQLQVSDVLDEAGIIEQEHEQLTSSNSNPGNSDSVPVPVQDLTHGQGFENLQPNSSSSSPTDGLDKNDKVQMQVVVLAPPDIELEETSTTDPVNKFRHIHSDHPRTTMFMKLNEVTEKSKFANVIQRRLMHFDLKGAPPKVTFFKELIKLGQEAGMTGVLIEWEDTFPWKDNLRNLTATDNFYNLAQVQEIIQFAEMHGLEVIPLVQTFGHVEFILKQEEFRHLREVEDDPQAFCPSKTGAIDLIEEMILQTVHVHQNSRFVHVGCDEVYNLRVCNVCTAASDSKDTLFIEHVVKVAAIVRKLGKIPLIWDDMLRTIPRAKLEESSLGSLVEPMVWVYAEDIDRFVGWETWGKYSSVFPTIWIAGAFKGAFGETLTIPKLSRHAENTQRWVDIAARESHRWENGIGGIVLTGWSRYDHFAVLCELFPASIPSLIYSSLISSSPTPGASIKNRIFIQNGTESQSISRRKRRRRSRSVRRWVPHPQSLRIKDRGEGIGAIGSFARSGRSGFPATAETAGIIDNPFEQRQEHLATEFLRILNCPVTMAMTKTLLAARSSEDDEFSFVSRCNFAGVSFFRTTFRLRSLLTEIWDMIDNLKRGRGWVTQYNRRHKYSLPLRVDELIFKEMPRLKRNLALTAKSVGISLKALYSKDTILEWIEQNIWDAWQALEEMERAGEELKSIKVWPRRPIQSPEKMTGDLGLQLLGLENEKL